MQLQANFDKACSFIRSAASQGCDLAVLPEYHLTGWLPDDPKFFDLVDQSPQYLEKYCALAQELKICITARLQPP
jgi:predicted amidohydrolase